MLASEEGETTTLGAAAEAGTEEPEDMGPNPISPEGKELAWGFGSFLVFLVIMRLFLVPKVRKGMAERYEGIRADLEGADVAKADARAEVAKYEAALVEVRAEAAKRVDAARVTLDRERGEAIAAANARIAEKKAAATTIAVGKQADNAVVTQAVSQAMQNAGAR
jgi:F-type H+-transporting ATPase subunit b